MIFNPARIKSQLKNHLINAGESAARIFVGQFLCPIGLDVAHRRQASELADVFGMTLGDSAAADYTKRYFLHDDLTIEYASPA